MQSSQSPAKGSGGKIFWSVLLLVVIVVVILYLLSLFSSIDPLGLQNNGRTGDQRSDMRAQKSDWQAVFLDNGQVYFGKVENEMSDPVLLKDIYYLQVVQPLQQQAAPGETPKPTQPTLSLVELGNELHGPMSEMRINRSHILFIEDLKTTGKVVASIEEDLAKKKSAEK